MMMMTTTTPRCRVLCVDDNEDTCFMLTTLIGASGHEVEAAGGVGEAKRIARARRFDLYIIDNRYPDGTGVDLCRTIRALDPLAPVVFYSGAAYEEDKAKGFDAGAHRYVVKPDIDGLKATVDELLALKGCDEPVRD